MVWLPSLYPRRRLLRARRSDHVRMVSWVVTSYAGRVGFFFVLFPSALLFRLFPWSFPLAGLLLGGRLPHGWGEPKRLAHRVGHGGGGKGADVLDGIGLADGRLLLHPREAEAGDGAVGAHDLHVEPVGAMKELGEGLLLGWAEAGKAGEAHDGRAVVADPAGRVGMGAVPRGECHEEAARVIRRLVGEHRAKAVDVEEREDEPDLPRWAGGGFVVGGGIVLPELLRLGYRVEAADEGLGDAGGIPGRESGVLKRRNEELRDLLRCEGGVGLVYGMELLPDAWLQLCEFDWSTMHASCPATQNMDKYTHIEILKVFANFSYCFILYAFAITK